MFWTLWCQICHISLPWHFSNRNMLHRFQRFNWGEEINNHYSITINSFTHPLVLVIPKLYGFVSSADQKRRFWRVLGSKWHWTQLTFTIWDIFKISSCVLQKTVSYNIRENTWWSMYYLGVNYSSKFHSVLHYYQYSEDLRGIAMVYRHGYWCCIEENFIKYLHNLSL